VRRDITGVGGRTWDHGCVADEVRGLRIDTRRARRDDQAEITAMVHRAHLNPRDLDWSRFVVAEHRRTIVGVGQVRLHADGAHELASLVVERSFRGQGVAGSVVDALLTDDRGDMYTLIDRRFVQHFQRWRFHAVNPGELTRSIKRTYRVGRVVTVVASLLTCRRVRIVPLRRP
jgi:N-acetylglutamate synthase-like GNAT family acetyltransferase